jgi:hypothetical protein
LTRQGACEVGAEALATQTLGLRQVQTEQVAAVVRHAGKSKDTHKRLRQEIADLDRRIGLQIDALEQGIEPELVGARIAQLRLEKEQAEAALRDLAPDSVEPDADELIATLLRLPDLSHALRDAPMGLKRQVVRGLLPRGPLRQG